MYIHTCVYFYTLPVIHIYLSLLPMLVFVTNEAIVCAVLVLLSCDHVDLSSETF